MAEMYAAYALETNLALTLGALVLVLLAVALARRWQFRSPTLRDVTREQRAFLREEQALRKSLVDLIPQLEALAARVARDIDERTRRLDEVSQVAAQRLERLEALLGKRAPSAPAETSPVTASTAAPPDPAPIAMPAREIPTPTTPIVAQPPAPRLPASRAAPPAQQAEILALARSGKSAGQIAESLRRPIGEVELILSLHTFA